VVAHGDVKLFATMLSYNYKYVPVKAWYSKGYYWASKKDPERYSFGFQSCEPMAVTKIKFNTAHHTDQSHLVLYGIQCLTRLVQSNGDKTPLKREYDECKKEAISLIPNEELKKNYKKHELVVKKPKAYHAYFITFNKHAYLKYATIKDLVIMKTECRRRGSKITPTDSKTYRLMQCTKWDPVYIVDDSRNTLEK